MLWKVEELDNENNESSSTTNFETKLNVFKHLKSVKKGKCKIIEVKGPRDRLAEKQAAWIVYLKQHAKLDVSVAFVKE